MVQVLTASNAKVASDIQKSLKGIKKSYVRMYCYKLALRQT